VIFCESAQRALSELAMTGLTLGIEAGMRDGMIDTLHAVKVPLVVDGLQKCHIVPSQGWTRR